MSNTLTSRVLIRYAVFGLPLGFVGLPLYVHLPKYYADTLPLSLAMIGLVMFLARIVDCAADPFIGYLTDRFARWQRSIAAGASVVLALGVLGLFYFPQFAGDHPFLLLATLLVFTYLAYSILTIGFYRQGLALTDDYSQTIRVSAWREAAVMLGVLVATALPTLLSTRMEASAAYHGFAYIVVAVLAVSAVFALPGNSAVVTSAESPLAELRHNKPLRWIFFLFFLNAIPPSITATLFLFFTQDVLQMANLSGVFLLVYFLSAILAMPLWTKIAGRFGKRKALMAAMLLALSSFLFAATLGAGDMIPFALICIASGAALGGDLSILPSLLADAIGKQAGRGGFEFGIWNFISKFTLALAAGIALPVLSYAGYVPGQSGQSVHIVTLSYALLPCTFKFGALALLWVSPIDQQRRV